MTVRCQVSRVCQNRAGYGGLVQATFTLACAKGEKVLRKRLRPTAHPERLMTTAQNVADADIYEPGKRPIATMGRPGLLGLE